MMIIIMSADYQVREIVKYVPESMRIPSSNLKLQDAVGQGNHYSLYIGVEHCLEYLVHASLEA